LLYKKIKNIPPVSQIYNDELFKEKIIEEDYSKNYVHSVQEKLTEIFNKRKPKDIDFSVLYNKNLEFNFNVKTSVEEKVLREIGNKIVQIPEQINVHQKVKQLYSRRATMLESPVPAIDWGMGELLAYGSILLERPEIRFSGEDSRRGTFSHRHSVIVDVKNEEIYIPLNHISDKQGFFRIFDSPLSELAVLGFEYGYSTISQDGLTIWEAQFGDFANMAQPIIDQYIVCGEVKWGQTSNLVLLLPHSYEGQGAEHSSARLERYLQLCADNNIIVANLTTPAQFFHILRRQILLEKKKPLIVMSPKSILRHQLAVSSVSDFTQKDFQAILDDEHITDFNKVTKMLFCSGKIYYDLLQPRGKAEHISIIRIEQLYPFDKKGFLNIIKKYSNVKEYIWMQE
jgi:2-oxoglutarate dehydrogenase E1 component